MDVLYVDGQDYVELTHVQHVRYTDALISTF